MLINTQQQVSNWPKTDRPREKLMQLGAHTLTDTELLAIFLQTGTKKYSVLQLAQVLLEKFGTIRQVLHASFQELCLINGIGQAKCVTLKANLELAQRYMHQQALDPISIKDTSILENLLTLKLKQEVREVFACLFLDPTLKLIKYEAIFYGTLTHVNVHPREIAKRALDCNADSIILAHNHPFGDATPSDADLALTNIIKTALDPLEITVLDHMIIGANENHSFAQHGQI